MMMNTRRVTRTSDCNTPPLLPDFDNKDTDHRSTVPRGVHYERYFGVGAEGVDASGLGVALDAVPIRGRGVMPLQLLRDARDGSLCPITCMPFRDDCLEFLEDGAHLIKGQPDLCVSRLPCGHKFSSLSLAYHMCTRSMRCPMCRAGTDQRMRVSCIPEHIQRWAHHRSSPVCVPALHPCSQGNAHCARGLLGRVHRPFRERVREYIAGEMKEINQRDQEMARSFFAQDNRSSWDHSDLDEDFPMRMTVYIYGRWANRS